MTRFDVNITEFVLYLTGGVLSGEGQSSAPTAYISILSRLDTCIPTVIAGFKRGTKGAPQSSC